MSPDDRRYSKTHEWIKMEGEAAVVGITDHAQAQLGDITFVELPKPGKVLERGREFGVIESVKAASDIYSPVSGNVLESNEALNDQPGIVNKDPYGTGWLVKISGSGIGETDGLMDAAGYEAFIKSGV